MVLYMGLWEHLRTRNYRNSVRYDRMMSLLWLCHNIHNPYLNTRFRAVKTCRLLWGSGEAEPVQWNVNQVLNLQSVCENSVDDWLFLFLWLFALHIKLDPRTRTGVLRCCEMMIRTRARIMWFAYVIHIAKNNKLFSRFFQTNEEIQVPQSHFADQTMMDLMKSSNLFTKSN